MKKLFALFALLMAVAVPAFAGSTATSAQDITSIDVSKLTPEQKAALVSQVTDLSKQATNPTNISQTVRTEAMAWGELGANMGRAAVSAAKEIGVAANDFVQTPLGKVTMGVVLYKVMGHEIMKLITGGGILVFFFSMALYFSLKSKYDHVEYENVPVLGGLFNRRVVKSATVSDDIVVGHWTAAAVCVVLGMMIGLNVMF